MYRQLEHSADLRFELENDSFEGIFQDFADLLFDLCQPTLVDEIFVKTYEVTTESFDDTVFDVVNDWIYTIYGQRFSPFRCYLNSGILRCTFKRISVMNGIEIKALTYHDLRFKKEAGKIKAKVVFDV